jgi:hypothetical protein
MPDKPFFLPKPRLLERTAHTAHRRKRSWAFHSEQALSHETVADGTVPFPSRVKERHDREFTGILSARLPADYCWAGDRIRRGRSYRSSCWSDGPERCRAAFRFGNGNPGAHDNYLGLRVARVPVGNESKNPVSLDPDRKAAEYVLSVGSLVRVNDEDRDIRVVAELPKEAFRLTYVDLARNPKVNDTGLAAFKGCTNLTTLYLFEEVGVSAAAPGCLTQTASIPAGTPAHPGIGPPVVGLSANALPRLASPALSG